VSATTQTQTETLWTQGVAASASVPTASAVTACNGWPSIPVPPGFFTKTGKLASSAKLVIQGTLTATATVPTFSFGLAMTQAQPAAFSASTLLHAISATTTPTAGTAFQYWAEWDIMLRSLSTPGAAEGTLVTTGRIRCPSGFTTPFELTLPQSNGVNTQTFDPNQPLFLWPYITLSAATAGNTVTPQWGKLYGEN
jgi:hypothetical protein